MPFNDLTPYAAFRRWHQASEDLSADPLDPALLQASVWVVHFSGRRFNGTFDHSPPSYLCLTLAEARMVVGDVAGPSPMACCLHFDRYTNARIETVALAQVLQDDRLRRLLHSRLEDLAAYPAEAYETAVQHYVCKTGCRIVVLLLAALPAANGGGRTEGGAQAQLVQPAKPRDDWPFDLRWGQPQVVWNEEGLAGVMGADGQLLVPCQFAALRGGLSNQRLLALNEPVATIHEPIAPRAYTQFRCDVINSHTGQRINPPGTRALLGSLGHNGECVAMMEFDTHTDPPRMGFMDCDGQWLGGCQWAGVLLFHENLAAVQDPDTLLWGYLNAQGQVAIAPQFAGPGFFNSKRAMVQVAWPNGQPRTGHKTLAWQLIDTQGHTLGGPWAQFDFAPSDHYVVQALADAGSDIWSLIDENGATLIDRETVPAGEKPDEADELEGSHGPFHVTLSPKEKAAQHLDALWKARRYSAAQLLRHLPLAERLAQLPPQTERDLAILGLWGQRVRCTRPVQSIALGPMAEQVGTLEFSYPVSLSLFNLAVEAPVTFVRADGSTVCVGVPWDGLELLDGDTPGTQST